MLPSASCSGAPGGGGAVDLNGVRALGALHYLADPGVEYEVVCQRTRPNPSQRTFQVLSGGHLISLCGVTSSHSVGLVNVGGLVLVARLEQLDGYLGV
jgi:hypothetical protein